ncbi:NADH dehydrogenase subunit 1 (mitochondrion) [Paramicrosporidium saccamoebae]|uniref:NADH-ubiquinone oxidoreductase chain 1 n=1 Tax=Paramicrosporidium saccamoebae TaxID=1246581 RepID=A0A2H9TR32_9FUNG|nr:NADH dehydrogenase subunit 1 [Paramicrosporidium saccamoebae]
MTKITGELALILELIIGVLIGVAYLTLGERKVMGAMQRRKGPNIVGPLGILQPIIDGVKLLIKEILIPQQSNKINYILGPTITLILSLIIWIPIPIGGIQGFYKENNYSIIYILAVSSISAFILLYTGWSSNSKYTFLGAIRSIAQLISYEVSFGLIILNVMILNDSLNLIKIIYKQIYIPNIIYLFPIIIIFIISTLAETNRPPFDLPEAESELVAGLLTEYGGFAFAALYLAEYAFVQSMSILSSILFLGSTYYTIIFIFIFIWVRASLPRIRYDQLMNLGWAKILPFTISYLIFILSTYLLFTF